MEQAAAGAQGGGEGIMSTRVATMRAGLVRLIAAAASAVTLVASPALAEPVMWVVKDVDSTIYLLGTVHLIKPGMKWRSDKIEAAFESSDEYWMEATDGGDMAALGSLLVKHGYDRTRPLSTKLTSGDWARVKSAAKTVGLPITTVERMRPWLAALALGVRPAIKGEDGYDVANGVDRSLEASARAEKKPVRAFETPEQQLQIFSSLSEGSEVALLVQSLDEIGVRKSELDRMIDAWMEGDLAMLEAKSVELKTKAPELYDAAFVRRNLDWCDQIADIMNGSGTSFIAVGAAHLIGDQSVPDILAKRGFSIARY
jgi:uncharacterized protein YbaP (TraB family)